MIAVTGATGWLGRAAVARLLDAGRPFAAFASTARTVVLGDGRSFATRALGDLPEVEHDQLLHLAFVTREHAGAAGTAALDAYVAANARITSTVLDAIERHRPAVAYASSGAAAAGKPLDADPYGALKRLDEHALRGAAPSCAIARVFNVAGPHMLKTGFALGDLILQARDQDAVTVRAGRPVVRSFVDVEDLADLLLALLATGQDAAFDTAGEEIELGDLARRVTRVLGRPQLPVRRDLDPLAAPDRYAGDPGRWTALCAQHGVVPRALDEQIARTAAGLAGATAGAPAG